MRSSISQLAENELLGGLVASGGEALDDLTLSGDDFEQNAAADLYEHLKGMRSRRRVIDLATVADGAPDPGFVFSLDTVGTSGAVFAHADIVSKASLRRRLQGVADALRDLDGDTVTDVVEEARRLVDSAVGEPQSKVRWVADILPDVLSQMEADDLFVPSPWRDLNKAIGGFRPGAVYVVGARPGVGKSVVAAQIAAHLAAHGTVAFSSLEMSDVELVGRMVAERLSIPLGRIKNGRMHDGDWSQIAARRSELESLQVAIDDQASVTPQHVRQFARSVSRKGKLACVVVDYLQLMSSVSKTDRYVQVGEFSRQLKILAKDFNVPVIALSQLNRASESRIDGRPKLQDLRESGSIEQDADCVFLLSREENLDGSETLILDVAKNRHGEVGEVRLSWQGMYSRAGDNG